MQCIDGPLKVAVACTATALFYAKLWRIFHQVITVWLALKVFGSAVAICLWRYRWKKSTTAFSAILRQELRGIVDDFTAAPLCCLRAHRFDWRSLLIALYAAASALPKYALYGPVLGGIGIAERFFFAPFRNFRQILLLGSAWCADISQLPRAPVVGAPLQWGGGVVWVFLMTTTSFLSCMLLTHLSGTLAHRFFAHRCFCTSRGATWVLYAFCSLQTAPIWWSSLHRRHHRHTDTDTDPHPPGVKGFGYAYLGWLTDRENFATRLDYLRDWADAHPELLLLELVADVGSFVRRTCIMPLWAAAAKYALHTQWADAPDVFIHCQAMLVMAAASAGAIFAVHMSLCFNAYAHQASDAHAEPPGPGVGESTTVGAYVQPQGRRPFAAKDLRATWFAYLSSGESYHERHHKSPRLAQNSPRWREDWVYWCIWCMERAGLAWKVVRQRVRPKVN